jgi:hypothetical protein
VTIATAWAKSPDAFLAGVYAAEMLKARMNGVEPHIIILTECFAEKADKAKVAKGVASVFGSERVIGISSYGFYTRDGVADREAVGLMALGGDGIAVRTAFVPKLNSVGLDPDSPELACALGTAGRKLAEQFYPIHLDQTRVMIVLADTHSPKNQLLLDGIQSAIGTKLPITGGSVNKNNKQNWVHWKGGLYTDAAIALTIEGNVAVAMNGAQARDNQAVFNSAKKVASDLKDTNNAQLFLAFDCAGRKSKVDFIQDAQRAVIEGLGKNKQMPIFGMWCAGEFGCPDDSLETPVGRGWHIMGTVIGKR